MAIPTFQLKKISADGEEGPFLNDFISITFSDQFNETPGLQFQYPTLGAHRAEYLQGVEFNEVAFYVNGQEADNGRFIVDEIEFDPIDDAQSVRTYTGAGFLDLLEWTKLWLGGGDPDSLVYTNRNIGYIIHDLAARNQALWGHLIDPTVRWGRASFTQFQDSSSTSWSLESTVELPRGYSIGQVIQDFKDQDQVYTKFRNRQLYLYETDQSVDRTIGSNQVLIEYGRDIESARLRQSSKNLVSATGSKAATLTRWWIVAAFARDRMVREEYLPDSNIQDDATRDRLLSLLLDRRSSKQRELTVRLNLDENGPYPAVDYFPGDWVWVNLGGEFGRGRWRVQQYTITVGENGRMVEGDLILSNIFDQERVRQAKLLRALTQGRVKLP